MDEETKVDSEVTGTETPIETGTVTGTEPQTFESDSTSSTE